MTSGTRSRPPAWRVLIAGGGLPSLALALALSRSVRPAATVTVCDPGLARSRTDSRAFALSTASVRMLDALGAWAELRPKAQPTARMTITDSRVDDPVRPAYLAFGTQEARETRGYKNERADGALGFMIEAAAVGPVLEAACRALGVAFRASAIEAFEAGRAGIVATLSDGEQVEASLLVAADGGRSRLREAAGIGWVGGAYRQAGIVGTLRHERDHHGRAVQHFLPSGPFALLPLVPEAGLHRSSIVWTERQASVPALLASPPDACLAEVRTRVGAGLGAVSLASPLQAHPLAVGLARRFVGRRLALLGDAAHEIHPLAGQGLNLGLADAASLAERVVDAVRLGVDPGGDEVLAGYERDRRFDAVLLAATTDGLNRLFSNDALPLRFLRDLGLGLVDRAPGLKRFFEGQAGGRTARAPRLMRGETL